MDPNPWANVNQPYPRLASGTLPTNPGSINLMDQHGLSGLGLSGNTAPRIGSLPQIQYGHAMSQFLDTTVGLPSVTPSFISQSPYKTVPVGQPAFSLESPKSSGQDSALAKALYGADPLILKEQLLVNATSVTSPLACSTAGSSSESTKAWGLGSFASSSENAYRMPSDQVAYAVSSGGSQVQEPPPAHQGSHASQRPSTIQRNPYQPRGNYAVPPGARHALNPPQAHSSHAKQLGFGSSKISPTAMATTVSAVRMPQLSSGLPEPPAAHSQSHSLSQQSSISDLDALGNLLAQQQQYHASKTQQQQRQSLVTVQQYPERSQPAYLNDLPSGQSIYSSSHGAPRTQQQQQKLTSTVATSRTQLVTYPVSPHDTVTQTLPDQMSYSSYAPTTLGSSSSSVTYHSTTTASAPASYASTSVVDSVNYDPVSPATPNVPGSPSFSTTISLQELATISAHQEKIPLASAAAVGDAFSQVPPHLQAAYLQQQQQLLLAQQQATITQTSPPPPVQYVVGISPEQQRVVQQQLQQQQQQQQQPLSSPALPNRLSPLPISGGQLSNQASSVANGCGPQMLTNLLQQPHTHGQGLVTSVSSIANPPNTIQALADSTTKPKRGCKRSSGGLRGGGGGGGGRRKRKTEQEEAMESPLTVHTPVPPQQQQQQQQHVPTGGDIVGNYQHHQGYGNMETDNMTMASVPQTGQMVGAGPREDEPVFLTNTFGNAFLTPHDYTEPLDDPPLSGASLVEENPLVEPIPYEQLSPTRVPKQRTKAEMKQAPVLMLPGEIDDEFAHLTVPPVEPSGIRPPSKPKKVAAGVNTPRAAATTPVAATPPPAPSPAVQSKPKKDAGGFMNSFLSFIQGNKAETLSSVTNSTITKKPEMPKYIPDTRPRITERKAEPSLPRVDVKKKAPGSSNGSSLAFSDDDEDSQHADGSSQNINKAVQNVLSNLTEDSRSEGSSNPPSVKASSAPSTAAAAPAPLVPPLKITLPKNLSTPMMTGARHGRGHPKRGSRSCGGKKYRSRSKRRNSSVEDFDPGVDADGEEDDAAAKPEPAAVKVDDYLPTREKSTRKAKEKVEKKREERQQRKSTGGRKTYAEETGPEEEFIQMSSSGTELDYDSEKDPEFNPFDKPVVKRPATSSASEDEEGKPGRRIKRIRSSQSSGRGRRKSSEGSGAGGLPQATGTKPVLPQSAVIDFKKSNDEINDCLSSDEEPVHSFEKGSFVIDRRDLGNLENFAIWKIDAGRLLQKYEPINRNGALVHKALSTYSSWSDNIQSQFKAVGVMRLSGYREGGEVVEVLDQFKPKPVDDKLEEHEFMQAFNVYIQILVSQALEPDFLSEIKKEKDNYYTGPVSQVESLLQEAKSQLMTQLNWTDEFRESVNMYPFCTVKDQCTPEVLCQAVADGVTIAEKLVQFCGQTYDRETLEPLGETGQIETTKDFHISALSAEHLRRCFTLQHFKYLLYKRCKSKVSMIQQSSKNTLDQSDILDQCLQNRCWILKLFKKFKNLANVNATGDTVNVPSDEVMS